MVTSNEDDLTRSKKLSWLLSSIYICDMSVLRLLSQISPSLSQYGESNQNHDAIQKSLVTPLFNMIDSIIVSSTSLRLSLLNWWLSTQALQVLKILYTTKIKSKNWSLTGEHCSSHQKPKFYSSRDDCKKQFKRYSLQGWRNQIIYHWAVPRLQRWPKILTKSSQIKIHKDQVN